MAVVSVRIPQIGEGLQEARLVAVLKQPGERVKRDEPIYQMETDKAVMDVESPYEGILQEWLANPDDMLAVGAEVARMEVEQDIQAKDKTEPAGDGESARNVVVPPRTRSYAKEKGLTDEELAQLTPAGSKLMPSDIDAYLAGPDAEKAKLYVDVPLSPNQRLLSRRLVRGNVLVVPGTISVPVNWEPIERERARVKASGDSFQPSAFTMLAFAVARTLKDFPAFRSSLVGEETLRTYEHASLGIAVGLPKDELVLAVVENADALPWKEFAQRAKDRIQLARTGKDQANETVTISLTNMQGFGIRDAIPVVVPPAIATLFIGDIYVGVAQEGEEFRPRTTCNLALTFDHRVINGVGAAQFLNAIKQKVEAIDSIL